MGSEMSQSVETIDDFLDGRRRAWLVYGGLILAFMLLPWMMTDVQAIFVWDVLESGHMIFTIAFVYAALAAAVMIGVSRAQINARRRARVGLVLGCGAYVVFITLMLYGLQKMDATNNRILGFNGWFPLGLLFLGCGCVMRAYQPATKEGRVLTGLGTFLVLLFFLTPPGDAGVARIERFVMTFVTAPEQGARAGMHMMVSSFYLILFGLTLGALKGIFSSSSAGFLRKISSVALYFTPFLLLMLCVLGVVLHRGALYPLIFAYGAVFMLAMNELIADGCLATMSSTSEQP